MWVGGENFIYVDLHVTSACVSKYFVNLSVLKLQCNLVSYFHFFYIQNPRKFSSW